MVAFHSLTVVALLATAAISTPVKHRRQEPTSSVIFRSDLKSGEGQSPEFKNLLCKSKKVISLAKNLIDLRVVSTTANNKTAGGFDITFVNIAERTDAAAGVIQSKGIPLNATDGSTRYFNIGTQRDLRAPQPVTLGKGQNSLGFLYTQGGELKLGSTTPQWDTWLICNGASHPELSWVGVVQGVVEIPDDCSAVRLFAEDPTNPTKNMGTC